MILGKAELHFRTEHAFGLDSPDRGGLQWHRIFELSAPLAVRASGEPRAYFRERRGDSGACVGRAAYNLEMACGAGVHFTQIQSVGVGMAFDLHHLCDKHVREGWRDMLDALDFEPRHRQATAQFIEVRL